MAKEIVVPLTIDLLIGKLEEAKKMYGGDTPIEAYFGDGDYQQLDADDARMEVIEASNIYPETRHFAIQVSEDTDFE